MIRLLKICLIILQKIIVFNFFYFNIKINNYLIQYFNKLQLLSKLIKKNSNILQFYKNVIHNKNYIFILI